MDCSEYSISYVSRCLYLLKIYRKTYLCGVNEGILFDHFMSLTHGLEFLETFLQFSENKDLILRIHDLVSHVENKLYVDRDKSLVRKLDHAYTDLREKMKNVIMKPRTNEFEVIFPTISIPGYLFSETIFFICEKISLLISDYKADHITQMIKDLVKIWKMLSSLRHSFKDVTKGFPKIPTIVNDVEKKKFAALTSFVNRATCLIYLTFVGMLNEDMMVSVRKNLSLLIEETDIHGMCHALGEKCNNDNLEADSDLSILLLKRQERYHIGTINEDKMKDDILSLKHGIEILKRLPKIYIDRDLKQRSIVLAGNVRQKIESLAYEQGDESLKLDESRIYDNLREEMKNAFIDQAICKYDTLFPEKTTLRDNFRSNNDFLLEKIRTLLTSNCKAHKITPLMKELHDIQKMITSLKPLFRLSEELRIPSVYYFHCKATFPIYLSFVGEIDKEMVLLVKSSISTTIGDTDVLGMYTMTLNKVSLIPEYRYPKKKHRKELYLLENLLLLLERSVESFNAASSKLYTVLNDIHAFLLRLPGRKLDILQQSFQAILGHSIPIVCSCYLEEDVSAELNCVLDLIKQIKSEAKEIKLYYFPKTDDFGFLEFFSGYLEDLMENQEIPMKNQIHQLHCQLNSLLSKKIGGNEIPWIDITNMAYQAEYIIDIYLVSSSGHLVLISSLSKIIDQLKIIEANIAMTSKSQLLCHRLPVPAQDVVEPSKSQVLGMTTQVIYNDQIVGLEEKVQVINEYLLKGENKLDVTSIVGMAGVGKTTLALTLYKDSFNHFDIITWSTVSQSYKNRDLLLSILDQIDAFDKSLISKSDDQDLADHLCRCLKKRRYLIVLDDIWDTGPWNNLKHSFPDDKQGSRILITTRNRDFADQIKSNVYELHLLSKEKSWELFKKRMLQNGILSDDLPEIAQGIVEHCKGLPLSIVIISGILIDIERTEKKWNEIAESVSSIVLSDPHGNCKAILELSYNHLKNHLRSCFLYLGSFLEDEVIAVSRLIILWVAEGLVLGTELNTAEEVAKKYMEDLIAKSLVIPVKERSQGGVKTFRLHDLLRDFCLDKAKEDHFFTVLLDNSNSRPLQEPRRLIIKPPPRFDGNSRPLIIKPQRCYGNSRALIIKPSRCFDDGLPLSFHSGIRSFICYEELESSKLEVRISSNYMTLLRVLVVGKVHSDNFPNISSLFHLRYLALGLLNWNIQVLPSSISKLQNLQILIIRCEYYVTKVPDSIWDMVKLRHVHITPQALFQIDSNRLEKTSFLLENLRVLSKTRVSCSDSKWLSKLAGVERLSCVFVDGFLSAKQTGMLIFNGHLTSLKLENESEIEHRFVSTCQLPVSLQELTLSGFFLTSDFMAKIGALGHLQVFKMYNCYLETGQDWNVVDDDFPRLKILKLRGLATTNWITSEVSFPSLEKLYVERCDFPVKIPPHFAYLENLRFISVRECAVSVDDSAREIQELLYEDQNNEMRVHIHPTKL